MESRCDNVEVQAYSIQLVSFRFTFEEKGRNNCVYLFPIKQDCDDSSDEKNCRMVSFDKEKYLKNKPPPPTNGLNKLPVTARYEYKTCFIPKALVALFLDF